MGWRDGVSPEQHAAIGEAVHYLFALVEQQLLDPRLELSSLEWDEFDRRRAMFAAVWGEPADVDE